MIICLDRLAFVSNACKGWSRRSVPKFTKMATVQTAWIFTLFQKSKYQTLKVYCQQVVLIITESNNTYCQFMRNFFKASALQTQYQWQKMWTTCGRSACIDMSLLVIRVSAKISSVVYFNLAGVITLAGLFFTLGLILVTPACTTARDTCIDNP